MIPAPGRTGRGPTSSLLTSLALFALGLAPATQSLRDDGPGRNEAERIDRGYYEKMLDSGHRFDLTRPVEPAPFDSGRLCNNVADLREYVLKPSMKTTHRGATWTTNALGMRDREYSAEKPRNTLRLALVGDSIGAGWGVDDGLGFESLVENSLDARSHSEGGPTVEFLNFSVPGHAPGQRWEHFSRAGWPMRPDVVIFEATPADPGWDERRLRGLLARDIGWDSPLYHDALTRTGARPGGDFESYKKMLRSYRWEILENVYQTAAEGCRSHHATGLWLLIPRVGKAIDPSDRDRLVGMARSAGFSAVIDLSDAFDGIDPASLAIAANDFHPNARGACDPRGSPARQARIAARLGEDREGRTMSPLHDRAFRSSILMTLVVVVLALVPLPGKALRSALRSIRSPS